MYRCERRTLRPKGKGIAVSAGRRRRKATRQGPFLFLQTNVFSTALNGYDSLTATSDQMVCLLLGSLKKGTDTRKQICWYHWLRVSLRRRARLRDENTFLQRWLLCFFVCLFWWLARGRCHAWRLTNLECFLVLILTPLISIYIPSHNIIESTREHDSWYQPNTL
jgi:hypothetical protein